MPNPRNLNYVLGSIGQTLVALSEKWGEEIPAIQCLVLSKRKRLPGAGIGWLIGEQDGHVKLLPGVQQELVVAGRNRVYEYRKWPVVLETLGLSKDYSGLIGGAITFRGGGESERHKKLKEYVSEHPAILHLPPKTEKGTTEFGLPSGDRLDVLFKNGDGWHAAEVKSAISNEADITRGMFQCVKYRAVMEGYQALEKRPRSARVVLVLEGSLPPGLENMKQLLNVEVIDGVRPR